MNSDENDGSWRSYEIGYGKPPADRRFKKGKSGNPRGRPKKATTSKPLVDRSMRDTFLSTARREVTSKQGDVVKAIPLIEAAYQAESVLGLKGNAYALKNYLDRAERFAKDEADEIQEDNEYWRNYIATYEKNVSMLRKAGHPIPESWPHPDDIEFNEDRFVNFRGGDPIEASRNRELIIRLRDLLMLQSELDRRCDPSKEKRGRSTTIFVSDILYTHANSCLPKRMQLSENQILFRLLDLMKLSKKSLEQQLKVGWAYLGRSHQRNQTTPPITAGIVSQLRSLQTTSTASLIERWTRRRGQRSTVEPNSARRA